MPTSSLFPYLMKAQAGGGVGAIHGAMKVTIGGSLTAALGSDGLVAALTAPIVATIGSQPIQASIAPAIVVTIGNSPIIAEIC